MSSNFQHYRRAARDVASGWLRGNFSDSNGNKCLVQGVLNSVGPGEPVLPFSMAREIDSMLGRRFEYRLLRSVMQSGVEIRVPRLSFVRGKPYLEWERYFLNGKLQDVIMAWNDLPWRRKQEVVGELAKLADELEFAWLRDEHTRLTSEVSTLRTRVKQLEEKVKGLEEENGVLKRLTNSFTLRKDRENLQELSDELDGKWEELQELPPVPVNS